MHATDDDDSISAARFKWKPFKTSKTNNSKLKLFHSIATDHAHGFDRKTIGDATSAGDFADLFFRRISRNSAISPTRFFDELREVRRFRRHFFSMNFEKFGNFADLFFGEFREVRLWYVVRHCC